MQKNSITHQFYKSNTFKFKLSSKAIFIPVICFYFLLQFTNNNVVRAQKTSFLPVVSYSFSTGSVIDDTGNSTLSLFNGAALINDASRGSVLHFQASEKSYAVFNRQLINSDNFTISFFFYWESQGAGLWHQLFELHNPLTNSNIFFTPQNGWGKNECSFISDCKEFGSYEAVSASPLPKNTWMNITITLNNKLASIYINGVLASSGAIMFTPDLISANSLYLGCNPNRSNNYYVSARLDDIKIFETALAANQIQALAQGNPIPEPENYSTVWETKGDAVQITVDILDKKQTIQNFGSSDGWNTERIGKYWPEAKKEKLAELLFSAEKDADGNPKGIGLSAWRFNIGAGTSEQGDASRISVESRRTEGFLNADGSTYNWNKQIGQQWFLKKAVTTYHIHQVIGWQNSPPVAFTKNNLGFRDYGTPMATILKPEYFDDFGRFLADVAQHFNDEGIHIDYISPLNEPQWGWAPSSSGGTVSQEGTPWTNQEIHDVVVAIGNEFKTRGIDTKLFISEAGTISHVVGGNGHASNQLYNFWNTASGLSLVGKPSFANIVSYHSYFNDFGSQLVTERKNLFDKAQLLNPVPELWQTEYSLLGDGYRDGYAAGYSLSEMDCALSLVRTIITDLNVTNVSAWQWWSTFEKGKHGGEPRFCLIEAPTRTDNSDGTYHVNKLFYSYGNIAHFVRPGMKRIGITRSDNVTALGETTELMLSAYTNPAEDKLVIVAANHTSQAKEISLSLKNVSTKTIKNPALYLTDEFTDLKKQNIDLSSGKMIVPARSVVTYTADLSIDTAINPELKKSGFATWLDSAESAIKVSFEPESDYRMLRLFSIGGKLIQTLEVDKNQSAASFSTSNLPEGIYLVSAIGNRTFESKKVLVTKQ